MNRKRLQIPALAAVAAVLIVGVAIAVADDPGPSASAVETEVDGAEGADSDQPLGGSDRQRAEAAALEYTGGGTVTETEVGDGGAAYGVEILRDDGSQIEVHLDENFVVIGTEPDDD